MSNAFGFVIANVSKFTAMSEWRHSVQRFISAQVARSIFYKKNNKKSYKIFIHRD